ncbi:hypothetical protein DL98DRAFT_270246 [Cadophora sp. DSE1049]|nr:hypothetical protein DL98DRAFT_270246 [Cadophora sp. DSE1049]
MKFTNFLSQIALSLLTVSLILVWVPANPVQDSQPLQDVSKHISYPVTPMRFEGTIYGIPINASGTVEEIYAQAAKNPLFAIRRNTADCELVTREKVRRVTYIHRIDVVSSVFDRKGRLPRPKSSASKYPAKTSRWLAKLTSKKESDIFEA